MFSEKQEKLIEHLLASLGFELGDYKTQYKTILTNYIAKKCISKFFNYTNYAGKLKSIDVGYNAIDSLFEEIQFRKSKGWTLKEIKKSNNFLTASDLSSYVFCPVSYSISKTFHAETSADMETGTLMHEKFRLLRLDSNLKGNKIELTKSQDYEEKQNTDFFTEVGQSILIHSGHNDESKNYYNSEENFCGNPDYVFEHPKNGYFIVEEKFRNDVICNSPFQNHKVQLASYLYKLKNFNAQYGYLLYWLYKRNFDDIYIHGCRVFRIDRSKEAETFVDITISQVRLFNDTKRVAFDVSLLSAKKCVNCSLNKWCGHKSRRYKEIELPYHEHFLATHYSKYNSDNI